MSQGRKGKVNYRCPVCFDREWDIDLLYDKEKNEYYCLRCTYVGGEADILALPAHQNQVQGPAAALHISGF
jgi:hypothetical protein